MQLKFNITHSIDAPAEAAWAVLRDMTSVAQCMPGASITEQVGDTQYKGTVSVRVGPVQSSFGGLIDVTALDESAHSMVMSAKGSDSRGSSSATMQLSVSVTVAEGGGCALMGNSEIKVMGKMANFGARMINGVADQIINQFLTNFTNQVVASGVGQKAADAADKLAQQPKQLNALALLWGLLTGFLRRLFGRREPS